MSCKSTSERKDKYFKFIIHCKKKYFDDVNKTNSKSKNKTNHPCELFQSIMPDYKSLELDTAIIW